MACVLSPTCYSHVNPPRGKESESLVFRGVAMSHQFAWMCGALSDKLIFKLLHTNTEFVYISLA